jgi:hypothetical protein
MMGCAADDLEERDERMFVPVERRLGRAAGAIEEQRGGVAADRAHRQPLRPVADST